MEAQGGRATSILGGLQGLTGRSLEQSSLPLELRLSEQEVGLETSRGALQASLSHGPMSQGVLPDAGSWLS